MSEHVFTKMLDRNLVTKEAATEASSEIFRTTASEQSFARNLLMFRGDIEQLFYTLLLREVLDQEVAAFIGIVDLLCGDLDDATSAASVATGGVAFASI